MKAYTRSILGTILVAFVVARSHGTGRWVNQRPVLTVCLRESDFPLDLSALLRQLWVRAIRASLGDLPASSSARCIPA